MSLVERLFSAIYIFPIAVIVALSLAVVFTIIVLGVLSLPIVNIFSARCGNRLRDILIQMMKDLSRL